MLLLVFLCMVALAVALCRVDRIERSLDMMVQLRTSAPAPAPAPYPTFVSPVVSASPAPSTFAGGGGGGGGGGGWDYGGGAPPIQLPIAPPLSSLVSF